MTNQTFPKVIPLRTRKFSCFFEPDTGFLRRIKSSGVEVIRTIYGAVRDKNWDTIEPRLKIERLESDDDSFCLEFSAQHADAFRGEASRWNFVLTAAPRTPFYAIGSAFARFILSPSVRAKPAGFGTRTACGKKESFRFSFLLINRSKIFERFPGSRQTVFMPVFSLKATSSKWRTSEIGRTLRSRPIARLLSCPSRSNLPPTKRFASVLFSLWS